MPENSVIDFLSIDVEGHEFQVLKSIDLIKYKPKVILLESHLFKLENYANDVIVEFLKTKNYTIKYYSTKNIYFCHSSFIGEYFEAFNA